MKKICSLVLLLGLIASLFACGKTEITMQEIYDANQTDAMLKNHESISVREVMDGEIWRERYLTKAYTYDYFPGSDAGSDWSEFVTDDVYYYYASGACLYYLSVTPDGMSDFSNLLAERYEKTALSEDILKDTIESVSKKDGRITVKSVWPQEVLAESGLTAGKFEYVLDAKTSEVISNTSEYAFDDGTTWCLTVEVSYDAEAPEMVKTFLAYANQTEDLRNVTVVSNPGTGKEVSKTVQAPKGLIIGLRYNADTAYTFEVYTDAACTESYDPYVNTDSDLTIYVKWVEKAE